MDENPDMEEIMAAFPPPLPKSRFYIVNLLTVAWEEITLPEIIAEALCGFMLPLLIVHYHIAQTSELKELFVLCIGAAFIIPFLAFIIRLIFIAPYELYKKQKSILAYLRGQVEWYESERDKSYEFIPFDVNLLVKDSKCYLRITNKSHFPSEVRLKILNIEPPMKGPLEHENNQIPWPHGLPVYYSDSLELATGNFECIDCRNNWLDPEETGTIEFFVISKGAKTMSFLFMGTWRAGPQHHHFIGEGEHIISFELLTSNPPPQQCRLKVRFSNDLIGGWTVEKVQ